jgi:tyrosyl-DNA phosphodiesterase 2
MQLQPVPLGGPGRRSLPSPFTVSTWNVWFDKHRRDERFAALLGIVRSHGPDLMAFQEVTPPFVRAVQELDWPEHWISATDHGNLGTLLIGRIAPVALQWVALPSSMGRRLLVADFPEGLRVAVCHLESLGPNGPLRAEQLRTALQALQDRPAVLLGDFNFGDHAPEAAALDRRFQDAWQAIHADAPGFSRDTTANAMARLGRETKQERLDRILVSPHLEVLEAELLGTAEIAPGLFPSDHFGLRATLQRRHSP